MAAHDPTVRRRPGPLAWAAWGFVLLPLAQAALLAYAQPAVARPLARLLEGAALWWGGCCLALLATARPHPAQQAWLLPAAALLSLSVARLLPRQGGGASPAELGLAVGAGAILLLTVASLLGASHGGAGAWAQAALDTLWVLSAALVVQRCLGAAPAAPAPEPGPAATVAAPVALLAAALLGGAAPQAVRGMRLALLAAALCWLAAGAAAVWRPAAAAALATPLRTLAWALVALGAAAAAARPGAPAPPVARPSLARAAAALLPGALAAAALLAAAASGVAPGELRVLALTGAARELVAALRRHVREDDLAAALLHGRRRLADERAAAAARSDAIARVVHDLLAPLNGVWVVERELSRARHGAGARLFAHVEQLRLLSQQLRALVRGQAPPLRAIRVDLLRAVDDALHAAAERAVLAGVRTTTSLDARGPHVIGDPVAVRRILDNLLSNALDATPDGGSVRVQLWDDPAHPTMLTLIVRDSGPGLDAARERELFAPRPLAAHGQRMGLGLRIVRELAEAMGGACGITAAGAGGGQIWVRLPRVDARQAAPQREEDDGDHDPDHRR